MKKIFLYGSNTKQKSYVTACEKAGFEVCCSYNIMDSRDCDALILSGGGDVNPALYGCENMGSEGISNVRDGAEYGLLDIFVPAGKPILGICRGHQIIAVYFGAQLIQHVNDYERHARTEEAPEDKVHLMKTEEGSFLYNIYGPEFMGNSAHHQAVKEPPEGFKLAATSDDGLIDGLYCEERKIYSTQFHPERMCHDYAREDTVDGSKIFDFFYSIV